MTGWNMQFMNHGRGTQTRRPGDNRVALLGIWLAPREPGEETYASATRPYHPGSGEYQTYRTQLRLKSLDKVFQPLVLVGLSCDRGCQSCRQIVLHGGQRRCHLFSGVLREQSQKHCMDGDRSVRWADAPGVSPATPVPCDCFPRSTAEAPQPVVRVDLTPWSRTPKAAGIRRERDYDVRIRAQSPPLPAFYSPHEAGDRQCAGRSSVRVEKRRHSGRRDVVRVGGRDWGERGKVESRKRREEGRDRLGRAKYAGRDKQALVYRCTRRVSGVRHLQRALNTSLPKTARVSVGKETSSTNHQGQSWLRCRAARARCGL